MEREPGRLVRVLVTAHARRETLLVSDKEVFTISVREPAEGNRANARVRTLLAEHFGVPISRVQIVTGHHASRKTLQVFL